MHVADICVRTVQTIAPDATAMEAAQKMRDTHVGTLLVLDRTRPGRHLSGILTDRDLVTRLLARGGRPAETRVEDIMTTRIGTCHARDTLFEAVQVMRGFGVRRLPVLDDSDQLLGIVSTDDIHAALGRVMETMRHATLRERAHEAESFV